MITDERAEEPPLRRPAEQGQPSNATVGSRLTDLERRARARIRQRPIVAVLAAVGIGYVFARIVSRAMR